MPDTSTPEMITEPIYDMVPKGRLEAAISEILDDVEHMEDISGDDSNPDLLAVSRDELSVILRRRLLGEK
jgi:hypothetical protein